MFTLSAMNRSGVRRSGVIACLVVAAAVPSGVVAFQQSGPSGPAPKPGDSMVNPTAGRRY